MSSVNPAAIQPDLSLVPFLHIKQPHLHHCLLEIKEEHGLVHCVAVDNVSGLRAHKQCLVRSQQPVPHLQAIEIGVVEGVPRWIEGHLRVVPCAAGSRQRAGKARIQGWIDVVGGVKVAETVLE